MTARPMTEETPEQLAQRVVDTWGDGNPPIVVLARALLSTSAAERRASPEPTDAELDDLADIIDEHVGEDHLAMERAAWHFVASRLSSAERGMREKAALFDYLMEYCSYSYGGDSYSEPSPPEFGIQWEWRASTTERPGMLEQLRRDAFAKFDLYVNEMDPDDEPTEFDRLIMAHRAALSSKGGG